MLPLIDFKHDIIVNLRYISELDIEIFHTVIITYNYKKKDIRY